MTMAKGVVGVKGSQLGSQIGKEIRRRADSKGSPDTPNGDS